MDVRVRHRLGPSDLVQQTFLEAKRDLAQFQGDTEAEFLNWLRALLRTNVLNQMRAHRDTEMRDPNREHGLDRANSNYGLVVGLATSSPTPGEKVSAKEEFEQTQAAIDRLPGHYQAVIRGRLLQDQTFAAIAQELQCTEGAARALFYRALTHLQEEIGALDDSAVGRTI
jgi:RNA polymerase sigma-70 factor (ECF subfamily)